MVLSLTKGKYCLGYCLRDKGQSLVPEPPERITGVILDTVSTLTSFFRSHHCSFSIVIQVLRDSFQSEIPTLNVSAILSLFIKVFFGLLAGVGYCFVVMGLTAQ